MAATLFIADPPHGIERSYNALRLAGALATAWLGSRTWQNARFFSRRELVKLVEAAGLDVNVVRGAIFFPPIGIVARTVAPFEEQLTRRGAPGAAFLALSAHKAEALL